MTVRSTFRRRVPSSPWRAVTRVGRRLRRRVAAHDVLGVQALRSVTVRTRQLERGLEEDSLLLPGLDRQITELERQLGVVVEGWLGERARRGARP